MFKSVSEKYEGVIDTIIHNDNTTLISGWLFSSEVNCFPLIKIRDDKKNEFLDIEVERNKRVDVYTAKNEASDEYLHSGFSFLLPLEVKKFSIFAVNEKVFEVSFKQ